MVINNIYVTNATKMSLSDRFTILQSVRPVAAPQRQRRIPAQDVELRNRRLLERLALQPIAEAASSIRKVCLPDFSLSIFHITYLVCALWIDSRQTKNRCNQ